MISFITVIVLILNVIGIQITIASNVEIEIEDIPTLTPLPNDVPTINISILYNDTARLLLNKQYMTCAYEIDDALQSEGVFMVTIDKDIHVILDENRNNNNNNNNNNNRDNNPSSNTIDSVARRGKASAQDLFRLDKHVLEEVSIEEYSKNNSNSAMRGYIGHGAESGLTGQFFESKDGYSYGHPSIGDTDMDVDTDTDTDTNAECGTNNNYNNGSSGCCVRTPLHGANIWPNPDLNPSTDTTDSENPESPITANSPHQMMILDLEDIFLSTTGIAQVITQAIATVLMQELMSEAEENSELESDSISTSAASTLQDQWREMMVCGDEISILRLFHYYNTLSVDTDTDGVGDSVEIDPATGATNPHSNQQDNILGSSPHTDWGFLTVIIQDNIGGLQLRRNNPVPLGAPVPEDKPSSSDPNPGYTWVDVNPPLVNYSIVVNGGDYLALTTQNRYISPIHRVLSPLKYNASDRYSFVLFFYPNYYSEVVSTNTKTDTDTNAAKSSNTNTNTNGNSNPKSNDGSYNTLLNIDNSNSDGDSESNYFGDYMIKKWEGVAVPVTKQ